VRWHWVYTATIFRLDQRGHTASRRPVITERGYVATRAGLESFERQVYAEALRRGLGAAVEVLVVADGAIWIWNLVENRFRLATQRVDLYHVKQHLWSVANELYTQDRTEARAWLRPLFHQLERKNNGAAQVLGALQELLLAKENLTPAHGKSWPRKLATSPPMRSGWTTPRAGASNSRSAPARSSPPVVSIKSGSNESASSGHWRATKPCWPWRPSAGTVAGTNSSHTTTKRGPRPADHDSEQHGPLLSVTAWRWRGIVV